MDRERRGHQQGPGLGFRRAEGYPRPAAVPIAGHRFGQWLGIHQQPPAALLSARKNHLYPWARREEKRRLLRGTEKLFGGAPRRGLRALRFAGAAAAPKHALRPSALVHELLPAGHETAEQRAHRLQSQENLRPSADALPSAAGRTDHHRANARTPASGICHVEPGAAEAGNYTASKPVAQNGSRSPKVKDLSHWQSFEKRSGAFNPCDFGHVLPFPRTKESLLARLKRSKYRHSAKMVRISENATLTVHTLTVPRRLFESDF